MGFTRIALVLLQSCLAGVVYADSTSELERDFAEAKDMIVINRLADLPADAEQMRLQAAGGRPLAEFGETWTKSDRFGTTVPNGQHLFSAISKELMVVLYQGGGLAPSVVLLLSRRNAGRFCLYRLGRLDLMNADLRAIQRYFDADALGSRKPECISKQMQR